MAGQHMGYSEGSMIFSHDLCREGDRIEIFFSSQSDGYQHQNFPARLVISEGCPLANRLTVSHFLKAKVAVTVARAVLKKKF
jgi:hypothetical protein